MKRAFTGVVSSIALAAALAVFAPLSFAAGRDADTAAHPSTQSTEGARGITVRAHASPFALWAHGKRVQDITDKDLFNRNGKQIGEIEEVVRAKRTHDLYAVVGTGGFLGLGQTYVTLPLTDLQMRAGKLTTPSSVTREQLGQRQAYTKSRYTKVPAGEMLLAAAGMGTLPGFRQVDRNHDGYISKREAQRDPPLDRDWRDADRNGDRLIDRSEFSAFESKEGGKPTDH